MTDIVFILVVIAFFALAAGYVSLCDRIIGPDPEVEPDLTEVDEPRVTVTR